VEAYGGRFEAVFILLHPFIAVPPQCAWSVTQQYPGDADILSYGSRYAWTEVGRQTGLASCARINLALLSASGSVKGDLADPSAANALKRFLQSQPVWMPTEGRFEPLLQEHLLHIFEAAGCEELLHVPEFPDANPVVRLALRGLRDGAIPFPRGGTLLASDGSFLFTVDWDSFFTLFYAPRDFIAIEAGKSNLEGFFATPNTDHAWFNYSMGCSTVTLSPEHWQSAEQGSSK
jgi:hypothetical protein